jgi:two-component system LytT family response regulator
MRTLIADDEPLARDRLRAMLRAEPAVELIGECVNGPETVAAIRAQRPDLVLLDLQMPGCDGLAVVAELSAEDRPAVVFVTAHDRHAVDAFRVGAVDYLMKPFDRERLQTALHRAASHCEARRANDLAARLEKLLADRNVATSPRSERFAVKSRGRVVFVEPEQLVRVESADNYVILHLVDGDRMMLRESLGAMEGRLGTDRFVRVNRSTIVALDHIKELRGTTWGDYAVILRDGTKLPLSRSFRGRMETLGGVGE